MSNTKIVKLMPQKPVAGVFRTPIYNTIEKVELEIDKIRLCLVSKCQVDEYLNDGTMLRLDLSNYRDEHNTVINGEDDEPAAEPVVEDTTVAEAVVVDEPTQEPVEEVKEETVTKDSTDTSEEVTTETTDEQVAAETDSTPVETVVETQVSEPVQTPADPRKNNKNYKK